MADKICGCRRWLQARGRTREAEEALLTLCPPAQLQAAVGELQQQKGGQGGGNGGGGGAAGAEHSSTWALLRSPAVVAELTIGGQPPPPCPRWDSAER